ncbi:hypothetical protein SAMN04487968_10592 [Nocardioides terrae]|uniref:Uncharacterized protein n=2 Tax=Nocardioides terrae TaxID=574651 RepID=A0A1I1I757_9ACTN|nr:hypothetical protein SAMN04487968_10592 [Nocardioides terrae]
MTGLSLGVLSPARAAEDAPSARSSAGADPSADPSAAGNTDTSDDTGDAVGDDVSGTVAHAVGQTEDEAEQAAEGGLTAPATRVEAQESLAEVKDLAAPPSLDEPHPAIASDASKNTTLALRDLSLRMSALPRTDRPSAYEQFQRPTYTTPVTRRCLDNICVHWTSSPSAGRDATADSFAYGDLSSPTPAPDSVLATMVNVSRAYYNAGYRYPRTDATLGGSGQTDIYLRDVGAERKYGYCTVDVTSSGHFVFHESVPGRSSDLPAFCVLDNDYSKSDFPTARTSEQDLKVTAAHEYFHAVQFAYDYLEDRWFMEATATWAEDQVFDSINDNVQYLARSQLRYPGASLDNYNAAGGFLHYGDWLFFEYLTERLPARQGLLPVLVRRMWQYADSVSGPDYYSIQAVAAALAEQHVDFRKMFGRYVAANRHPATAYAEGRVNHYPTGRPRRTARLRPSNRGTAGRYRVNHLASATVRFVPKHLRKHTRLTLAVDMANRRSGSAAVALVFFRNGRLTTKTVPLRRSGKGKVRVPFDSRHVSRVELVLANANRRYKHCSNDVSGFSCGGVSRRDHVTERFTARAS